MSFILTFLGKGGTGKTTMAIASAKKLAALGERVLLVSSDPTPVFSSLLGIETNTTPQEIAANLSVVQLKTTILLERSWEDVKDLEAKYLRSPTLKNVYGQELGVLPGMDNALALNAIREYDQSNKYDTIVYDGDGNLATLRMFGTPDIMSWYIRRFRQILGESDLGKAISPFIQPVTSAILNVSWNADNFAQEPTNEANEILSEGKKAVSDPHRLAAYLVTSDDEQAIAAARYYWGGAQQIGLTVGGVILNHSQITEKISQQFNQLPITTVAEIQDNDWQNLIDSLPNFKEATSAPKPLIIDTSARQVKVFLPSFDKKQVKLTQYGPEITIEAGDQRRNIFLPAPLTGQPVKGAKFQDGYLIISL